MIIKVILLFVALLTFMFIAAVSVAIVINRIEMRELKKKMKDIGMSLLVLITLASCGTVKHYQKINGLKQSGTYTVRSYSNNTATFKEFPGSYIIPNDTLKKGDRITITVIRPR